MDKVNIAAEEQVILIDLKKTNWVSIIITLGVAALVAAVQYIIHGTVYIRFPSSGTIAFILFLIVHEGLHGIGFYCYGGVSLREIKFGVLWKYLMPYCTCSRLLSKGVYLKAMLLPVVLTGIVSVIYALTVLNLFWAIFAGVVIGGGAADIMMAIEVMKFSRNTVFKDHPSLPGFFYRKED